MKPIYRNLLFAGGLLLSSTLIAVGETEIALAPCFGSGMVLQRSPGTILRGSGPPTNSLFIELRQGNTILWSCKPFVVDPTGEWQHPLDLTGKKFQSLDAPCSLHIKEKPSFFGKKGRGDRVYENILIGDVILVAGWEGQGVKAGTNHFGPGQLFERDETAVRFLDLTQAKNLCDAPLPQDASVVSFKTVILTV